MEKAVEGGAAAFKAAGAGSLHTAAGAGFRGFGRLGERQARAGKVGEGGGAGFAITIVRCQSSCHSERLQSRPE